MPKPALWLGAAGALPFLALAAAVPFARDAAQHALAAYAATILSFLGGIHWGLAIAQNRDLTPRLVLSVIPSLVAWVALLLPAPACLLLQAACLAAWLPADLRATRLGQAPAWYPSLRIPLSIVVTICLIAGATLAGS